MRRYLLFGGQFDPGPVGGWDDFNSSFDSVADAEAAGMVELDWWHVVDSVTGVNISAAAVALV